MKVTLYTQPGCMPCMATKRALTNRGVPHDVVDVRQDEEAAELLRSRGFPGTPVVIATVNGREYAWHGHRDDDIDALAFLVKDSAA